MKKSLGFIGGGKDTRILLNAINNKKLKFKRVVVSDVNPLVIERLKEQYPFIEAESASVAAGQGVVFLAMQHEMFMDTIGLINNDFNDDSIIVSLDPDINFAKLALRLQNFHKIARIMPSPSIFLNDAYVPVTFSSGFNQTEKDDVLDLFGNFGKAVEVPEEKLQVYSTMSAVLHSYFWPQMDEMMRMGKELGLTPDETIDFINESFRSSLFMRYRSGLPEDQMTGLMGIDRDEDENETRELYRQRLVNLYRRHKSERTETIHSRRER